MSDSQAVLDAIYRAIEEINPQLPRDGQIARSPEAKLFGPGGALDSLGLVNLVVATEQQLQDTLGVTVTLADERAMSQRNSPFQTVQTLANYADSLIKETRHG